MGVNLYFNPYHGEFFTEAAKPEQLQKMARYLQRTMGPEAKFLLELQTAEVQSRWMLQLAERKIISFQITTDSPAEFYYNAYEVRVLSVEEYAQLADNLYQEKISNPLEFREWLNDKFTAADIWSVVETPAEKDSVLNQFYAYCRNEVEEYVLEDWEFITLNPENE